VNGLRSGDHAYFVHSYRFALADPAHSIAHADYGEPVAAIIGRDNLVGTQFHPEKSQAVGLALIAAFLAWRP
jgi:glutamine amidotransferase